MTVQKYHPKNRIDHCILRTIPEVDSKEGFSLLNVFSDDKRSVKNLTIVESGLRPEAKLMLEPRKVTKLEPEQKSMNVTGAEPKL